MSEGDEKVKENLLRLLNEKYGICEEDFISSELCFVPAQNAVDVGLDRAMIGAYGHDDFVCAYPALTSMTASDGNNTIITVLADKEETGSEGNTGMQCRPPFRPLSKSLHTPSARIPTWSAQIPCA